MYCLDTSTLSAAGPHRRAPSSSVLAWLDANAHAIHVPAIVLAEIEYGITRLELSGAVAKAARLRQWLAVIRSAFSGRIEPIDAAVALRAGQIRAVSTRQGGDIGLADSLIAAVAELNGWCVLTGNCRHFSAAGVPCADVFRARDVPESQLRFPLPPDPSLGAPWRQVEAPRHAQRANTRGSPAVNSAPDRQGTIP